MNHLVPKPPASGWERYTQAAARSGIPPRAYLDIVNSDPQVRVLRLGKRQLLHVAREDADLIAQRLKFGGAR